MMKFAMKLFMITLFFVIVCVLVLNSQYLKSLNTDSTNLNNKNIVKKEHLIDKNVLIYNEENYVNTKLCKFINNKLKIKKDKIKFAISKNSLKNPNDLIILFGNDTIIKHYEFLNLTILIYNKIDMKVSYKKEFKEKFDNGALTLSHIGFYNNLSKRKYSVFDHLNDSIETFGIYYNYNVPRLAEFYNEELEIFTINNNQITSILNNVYLDETHSSELDGINFCVNYNSRSFIYDTLNNSNEGFKDIKMSILNKKVKRKNIISKDGISDCIVVSNKKTKSQKILHYTNGSYKIN